MRMVADVGGVVFWTWRRNVWASFLETAFSQSNRRPREDLKLFIDFTQRTKVIWTISWAVSRLQRNLNCTKLSSPGEYSLQNTCHAFSSIFFNFRTKAISSFLFIRAPAESGFVPTTILYRWLCGNPSEKFYFFAKKTGYRFSRMLVFGRKSGVWADFLINIL